MLASRIGSAGLLCLTVAANLAAQDSSSCMCRPRHEHVPSEFELRSSGSLTFVQTRPIGALARNINFGYGVNGAYLFRLDHTGVLSLRAEAGFTGYGSESERVPLSPTIGGRVQVNVVTTNYMVPMSIGPQLTRTTGRIRPYVNVGIGGQLFFTQSNVEGASDEDHFANTTNQSDWTSAWVVGGGIYLPVYDGHTKVLVDLGVQSYNGGHARYLRPGSIQDLPNSQVQITPFDSDTRMAVVRLGFRVGL